jgi:DNA polymerase-3 subunit alpha
MDKLSKRFSYETFQECIDNNQTFIKDNSQYAELFDIAGHLSGRIKTVSCHAGGVGIVDTEISDYMAMKLGSEGEHVIQVDKRIVEEIGIIKFDILGVQTLNLVKEIQKDLGITEYDININNPLFENDVKPYELLSKALTNGVFQVESAGMKDLLIRLQAKSLEEISAVLALYRPDSMGELEDYIERKNGRKSIEYIHPDMKQILESTYGCLIYQEQLLEIVRVFGGRTYGGADLFRKAIGKKDKDLVKKESEKLYQEIIDNGYDQEIARKISDDMSLKGGYLFNKSHSYSYAVLCFQTAFLKVYYPLYFFKALFNLNKDKAGMVNKYIIDSKLFNITVLPPHINKSDINFSIFEHSILFGLSAISGIGEKIALTILDERLNGLFKDFTEFLLRINPSKGQVISLIKSGAIPSTNKKQTLIKYFKSSYEIREYKPVSSLPTHKLLLEEWNIDTDKYKEGKKVNKDKVLEIYNNERLKRFDVTEAERYKNYIEECNDKYLQNEQFWEFESLQIFINDNPFEKAYEYISKPFEEVEDGEVCTIIGVIAKVQKKKDKNKKQFAYANIYSSFGLTEAIIWHSQLKEYEDLIIKGKQIAMLCKKDSNEKVIADKIKPYDKWLEDIKKQKGVR